MKKETKVGLSAVSGTAVAAIVIATVIVSSQIMAVVIDGRVVGYVENEEQYDSLMQRVKAKVSEQVGTENTEILIQSTNVTLETIIKPRQQPMTVAAEPAAESEDADVEANGDAAADTTVDTAVDPVDEAPPAAQDTGSGPGLGLNIFGILSGRTVVETPDPAIEEEALVDTIMASLHDGSAIKATVYHITINDKIMATLGTFNEASDVLQAIEAAFMPQEGDYKGRFLDSVAISGMTTMPDSVNVQKPDDVVAYLLGGVTEHRTYTAVEGDSIGNICDMLGVKEDELRETYSDYDFSLIREDDVFESTLTNSYVHYETVGLEIAPEPIDFETIEENTFELYLGQRSTEEEGVPGERMVTSAVTRVNGRVVDTMEVDSVTIVEPKPEIVLIGMRMIEIEDAYVGPSDGFGGGGNGPLGRPLNSWILTRSIQPGHNGADMVAPRGSPIFAAANGRIAFSGVYSSYGNLVIIDHGNGLQTYYAHCDTLNVAVGQNVMRGQQIATVGTTGRSTAYHLHFEVRVNGTVQEPMAWIG